MVSNCYKETDHQLSKPLFSMAQLRFTGQPQTNYVIFKISSLEEKQQMGTYTATFVLSAQQKNITAVLKYQDFTYPSCSVYDVL